MVILTIFFNCVGLSWLLAKIRRYQSPDEYPFTSDLPEPIIPPLQYPPLLHPNQNINVNPQIYDSYINDILPRITQNLPDKGESLENYGSTAVRDVECLQSLSRRIHFGKFVAEVKFQSDEERMTKLIKNKDVKGLQDVISHPAVERQVLERLATKARTYGRDPSAGAEALMSKEADKVDVAAVVAIYRDVVIPLTKEVEVEYLLARLD
jgi:chorismate mutase